MYTFINIMYIRIYTIGQYSETPLLNKASPLEATAHI